MTGHGERSKDAPEHAWFAFDTKEYPHDTPSLYRAGTKARSL